MAIRRIHKISMAHVYPYYVANAVEEIEDNTTYEGRRLDKLATDLAKGESMEKILRKK